MLRSDLVGLAKRVVIDNLCFLVLESAEEGLTLVDSDDIDRLNGFFLNFSLVVTLNDR